MKKTTLNFILFVTFAVFTANTSKAQIIINPYLGVAGSHGSDKLKTPSFGSTIEFFLDETFSIGGLVAYSTVEHEVTFGNQEKETGGINAGAFANYYWTDSDAFNLYTGAGLGYDGHSGPYIKGTFYYEIHAGARYQFSESFGLFSELGYGLSLLKVGVSLKL